MQTAANTIDNIQNPDIWGGPLDLRILSPRSFCGQIPDAAELHDDIKGFIADTLLYPPWSVPPGEIKFLERRFQYTALEYQVETRRRGFLRSLLEAPWPTVAQSQVTFWHAQEAAGYLEERWAEEWAGLFVREVGGPERDTMPKPVLLVPSPAPPRLADRRRRGLVQMAGEMGLDPGEFEAQIESGQFNYIVSKLVECESVAKSGTGYGTYQVRREYAFDAKDAEHNVQNVNAPGTVLIRKKEVGK